ncbi:hypothetical protein D6821_00515 [Candidatus Parcubacteria bacterium]|nr:MAG: hypothetical protein D6821_00515 [Candidatus Parcubacteria bacterium]
MQSQKVKFIFLGMFLGICLVAGAHIYGAGVAPSLTPAEPWNPGMMMGVSNGDLLTAARWNGLINKVEELSNRNVLSGCDIYLKSSNIGGDCSESGNHIKCHDSSDNASFNFDLQVCYRCGGGAEECGTAFTVDLFAGD